VLQELRLNYVDESAKPDPAPVQGGGEGGAQAS